MFKHTVGDASSNMILRKNWLVMSVGKNYRGTLPCECWNEKKAKGSLPCQQAYMDWRINIDRNVTIALCELFDSEIDQKEVLPCQLTNTGKIENGLEYCFENWSKKLTWYDGYHVKLYFNWLETLKRWRKSFLRAI